ncbi:MAG: hypothetical protein M1820_003360 [Bogoriella megaspora]|nr:MAG: hypothetical protein M1820_003360 [Bogoriella megaspora]
MTSPNQSSDSSTPTGESQLSFTGIFEAVAQIPQRLDDGLGRIERQYELIADLYSRIDRFRNEWFENMEELKEEMRTEMNERVQDERNTTRNEMIRNNSALRTKLHLAYEPEPDDARLKEGEASEPFDGEALQQKIEARASKHFMLPLQVSLRLHTHFMEDGSAQESMVAILLRYAPGHNPAGIVLTSRPSANRREAIEDLWEVLTKQGIGNDEEESGDHDRASSSSGSNQRQTRSTSSGALPVTMSPSDDGFSSDDEYLEVVEDALSDQKRASGEAYESPERHENGRPKTGGLRIK